MAFNFQASWGTHSAGSSGSNIPTHWNLFASDLRSSGSNIPTHWNLFASDLRYSGSNIPTRWSNFQPDLTASNAPNTGGYDCKFVDPPPDKLVCQICLHVSGNPYQVTCCGRLYCKACLDEHKKHSTICPNCRKRGQNFPDTRGEQEIKSLKVMCSNSENGCRWVGELRSLDDHLTTCGYALLSCPNKCMENNEEVRILRRDLDHHLKNKCPNRQYECPHCKATGKHCDIMTTHLDTCPKMRLSCPNTKCKTLVLRCDLADHRSKCPFEEVPCKYAGIGCEKELPRKDLEQHEKDDSFHLHLALETINEQEVKKRSCTFKMPEFGRHKSSKCTWYSPPFYTCPGGYKMCIEVDVNGKGDSAGTHVSVYIYLMKGRNDDNLTWPFTGKITITLLNQLADKSHHIHTVSFPPDMDTESNRRVVEGERSLGLGYPAYIAYDQLDFDATKNCQYLNDDSLYFKIEVQTTKGMKPWLTCTV